MKNSVRQVEARNAEQLDFLIENAFRCATRNDCCSFFREVLRQVRSLENLLERNLHFSKFIHHLLKLVKNYEINISLSKVLKTLCKTHFLSRITHDDFIMIEFEHIGKTIND